MSADLVGTVLSAAHPVEEDQIEPSPSGVATVREHEQDFLLADLNLGVMLAVSERFALELRLPLRVAHIEATFRDAAGSEVRHFESIHHRDETLVGPGDLELGWRLRLLRGAAHSPRLDVTLALSYPTGNTEPNPFELGRQGERHQHLFFGTGTVDPIAGLEFFWPLSGWALGAWSTGRTSLYDNTRGYRAGARIAAGVGARSGFGLERWSFFAGPEIYYEQASTWEGGRESVNSGRTDVIAAAGAFFQTGRTSELHLLAKRPFTVHTQGGQLDIPFVIVLGGSFELGLWSDEHEAEDHIDEHHEHHEKHDNGAAGHD